MVKFGLAWIPVLNFVLSVVCCLTSYLISHYRDITNSALPFISDTGTEPPASCWFGLLLNASGYCFILTAYVRYVHIKDEIGHEKTSVKWLNILAFAAGFIGAIGMSIVGCFQETTATTGHFAGAIAAFGCAAIYTALQAALTYHFLPGRYQGVVIKVMLVLRILLAISCFVTMVIHLVLVEVHDFGFQHKPTDDDRADYYICTFTEWMLVYSFFLCILTFAYEFSSIKIDVKVSPIEEDKGIPNETFRGNSDEK